MSIAMTEKKLTAGCQARIPDEQVVSSGLFQPYGSGVVGMEGVGAAEAVTHAAHVPGVAGVLISAAAGMASERGRAQPKACPRTPPSPSHPRRSTPSTPAQAAA